MKRYYFIIPAPHKLFLETTGNAPKGKGSECIVVTVARAGTNARARTQ